MVVIALTLAGYYMATRVLFDKSIPDAPCTMDITHGEFINDQYRQYQFKGSITLWLRNNMITIFGVYNTAEGMKKIARSLLLDHVKKDKKVVTAEVKATHVELSDEVHDPENFFARTNDNLTFHFQKIKKGEYLVMINNNWVATCREH
ncbi:hypothetical protein SC206_05495 [Rouxiella sp. T17]|uniref:hypothetical protein n=1 Tax=Rouxiella sp. T17 TaxID=3085684 RepID=UPI002FC7F883